MVGVMVGVMGGRALAMVLAMVAAMPAPAADIAVGKIAEIAPAFATCWQAPDDVTLAEPVDVTVRFALLADGRLKGPPRLTFASRRLSDADRATLSAAAIATIERCTPLRLVDGFGPVIAGKPITLRFQFAPDPPRAIRFGPASLPATGI